MPPEHRPATLPELARDTVTNARGAIDALMSVTHLIATTPSRESQLDDAQLAYALEATRELASGWTELAQHARRLLDVCEQRLEAIRAARASDERATQQTTRRDAMQTPANRGA